MADEQVFTLRAKVLDAVKASTAIGKINEELKKFSTTSSMKRVSEDMTKLERQFGSVSAIAGTATGSILSVGTAAVTATLSIAAFASKMGQLAGHMTTLRNLSQLTGVAADKIEQLSMAAQKMGVAPDVVAGGFAKMSQESIAIARNTSSLLGEIRAAAGGKYAWFADQLKEDGRDVNKLVQDSLRFLQQIPDAQKRANWAERLLGSPDIGRLFPGGSHAEFDKYMEEAEKKAKARTESMLADARRYERAKAEFDDAADNLMYKVAPTWFEGMALMFNKFARFMSPDREEIDKAQTQAGARGEVLHNLEAAQARLHEFIGRQGGHGSTGLRQNQETRKMLEGDVKFWLERAGKLTKEGTKEGVKEGLKEGFQQQSYAGEGVGGAKVWQASWGGGYGGGGVPRARTGGAAGYGGGGYGGVPGPHINTPLGPRPVHPNARRAVEHMQRAELPPTAAGPLLDMISRAEGTGNNYNDAFAHQHPDTDLSKMSIDQVTALSKTQHGSSAIGRFQFMSYTLPGLKKELGLSGDEAFTPAMQDRLARRLLQRRGYNAWQQGKLSDQAFMHNLSMEWAGLTDPYTGKGYYPGQTTGFPAGRQMSALEREKATMAAGAGRDKDWKWKHAADQAGGWPTQWGRAFGPPGFGPSLTDRSPNEAGGAFEHDVRVTHKFLGLPQGVKVNSSSQTDSRPRIPRGATMPVPSYST